MRDPKTGRPMSAEEKLLSHPDFREAEGMLNTPGGAAFIRLLERFYSRPGKIGKTAQETAAMAGQTNVVEGVKRWARLRQDRARRIEFAEQRRREEEKQPTA